MKRRHIQLCLFGVVGLMIVVPLGIHYHHWRAVQTYRAKLRAMGMLKSVTELAPRTVTNLPNGVPAITNLLARLPNLPADLLWFEPRNLPPPKEVVTWQLPELPTRTSTNLWPGLQTFFATNAADLADLRAACEASQIEFPVDYAALNRSSITRLSEAKRLLMLLSQDALVQLHDGHPAAALADVRAGLQFVAHWDREPLLITQLVRLALARVLVDATWQLLQFPDWSDAELAQLQAAWQELDLPATAVWTAQMEVALADEALQRLTRNQYLAEEARLAKWAETTRQRGGNPLPANGLLKRFTDRHPRWLAFWLWRRDQFALIHLQQYEAFEEVCREAATKGAWFDPIQRKAPTFARLDEARPLLPEFVANGTIGLKNVPVRYAEYECERQLVLTAIALERFRKAHGHLPDRLASLTPAFLASVPCDPMDGQPLRYRQKGEGSFMLYSVGADGRDDDGDPTRPPASAANWRRKDLVWPQAASVSEGLAALATGHVSYAASQQWFAQRYGLTNAAPDAPPQMSEEMKQRFLRRYGTLPPGVQLLAPTNQPAARTNQ